MFFQWQAGFNLHAMQRGCNVKTYQPCWTSFPLFPQPHQLSNQEWCHAALPGLSGGSPGDRPVPGQGLSGGFQDQSQWRDDVSSCCRTNGPQHGHRLAGMSERRTLFTSCDDGLMSFTSVLRWVSRTSAWRTGMATGPRPCTLRPAGATPRCWAGCCCTAERSWPTAGEGPRYTTRRRTANWRCVALRIELITSARVIIKNDGHQVIWMLAPRTIARR